VKEYLIPIHLTVNASVDKELSDLNSAYWPKSRFIQFFRNHACGATGALFKQERCTVTNNNDKKRQ
jgi:hypothetical protein